MKYMVTVRVDVPMFYEIEVDAESIEQAEARAITEVGRKRLRAFAEETPVATNLTATINRGEG